MTSLKVDKNCDLVFTDGVCDLVSGVDDVIQAIKVELEQNKGQFALNVKWGTPYLNETNTGILQEKSSKERVILEISKVIRKYKEVEKILNIDFSDDKINAEIQINGEVVKVVSN